MSLDTDGLKDEIRALGFSTSDVSDDNLSTIIQHCLKTYSDYKPQVRYSTITAVKNQAEYTPPAGYHVIMDVLWNPSQDPDTWWPLWLDLQNRLAGTADFEYPSLILEFRQKLTDYDKQWKGSWRLVGDDSGVEKIKLYPAPSSAETLIPVIWGAVWTAATFPARDRDLMFKGALAYCEYARGFAQQKQSGSGWSAGTYKVTGNAGSFLLEAANKSIRSWKFRLSGGCVAMRS